MLKPEGEGTLRWREGDRSLDCWEAFLGHGEEKRLLGTWELRGFLEETLEPKVPVCPLTMTATGS